MSLLSKVQTINTAVDTMKDKLDLPQSTTLQQLVDSITKGGSGAFKVSSVEEMNALEDMQVGDYCIVEGIPEYVIPDNITLSRFTKPFQEIIDGLYDDWVFIIKVSAYYYQQYYHRLTDETYVDGASNYMSVISEQTLPTTITVNNTSSTNSQKQLWRFKHTASGKTYIQSLRGRYIKDYLNNYLTGEWNMPAESNLLWFDSRSKLVNGTNYYTLYSGAQNNTSCLSGYQFRSYICLASSTSSSYGHQAYLYGARLDTTTVDHLVYKYTQSGWVDVTDAILVPQTTITPTTSSQTPRIPDGYRGFKNVTVNAVQTETKTINPSTSSQTVNPTTGRFISQVTVPAVTSSIDANIQSGNIKNGVSILGVTGDYTGLDTSDADAVPVNIRTGKTAYVNGSKITGTLPVVTYPVDPDNPENWDYQFVASTTAAQVTRDNVDYILGTYQVTPNSQPDSWMFEGNRKMKMGIPFNRLRDTIGPAINIRKGASIYGLQGTWAGEESEDTNIYNVSSVTEMNALTGMANNSICIVSAPTNTLPTGYTELVYIESTGKEYIDTNIVPKYLKSEFKFAYKDHKPFTQQVYRPVIGARLNLGGTYAAYIPVYPSTADATHCRLNCTCASTSSATLKTMLKNSEDEFKTYTILFNDENNRVYLDGDLIATFSYFDVPDITLTATLFGLNYGMAGEGSSGIATGTQTTIKLYYMKLWDKLNNTLVRDFIPCIQDSDNAIGLYDKVSNTFFGNLGTGGFIAGPKPATNTVYKYDGSSWVLLS